MVPVDRLYKYVSAARVDVLQSLKIRYTQVSALNDPFEALPAVLPTKSRAKFRDSARSQVKRLFRERTVERRLPPKKSKRQALQQLMKRFDQEHGDGAMDKYQSKIRRVTDVTTGFLCLSKTPDNILMWSHYAESHCGFLIEFDGRHPYFTYATQQIVYSIERPAVSLNDSRPSAAIMNTKSLDWSYEQEVRKAENLSTDIRPLPNGHHLVVAQDLPEDPFKVHLFDLPRDVIKGIVLGWKSTAELHDALKSALELNRLQNIPIRKAVPSRSQYRMQIISLDEHG